MSDILLKNLEAIRAKIGDRPVTLLAVTKTVPVERINIAINEGGVRYIGENRVQELLRKFSGSLKIILVWLSLVDTLEFASAMEFSFIHRDTDLVRFRFDFLVC